MGQKTVKVQLYMKWADGAPMLCKECGQQILWYQAHTKSVSEHPEHRAARHFGDDVTMACDT